MTDREVAVVTAAAAAAASTTAEVHKDRVKKTMEKTGLKENVCIHDNNFDIIIIMMMMITR